MAKVSFDYHGYHIDFSGPSFTPLWSGLKYYYSPFDRELHTITDAIELEKAKVFVDVGACLGVFSMIFSQMCPNATIHAYEPAEVNYKHLVRNMSHYPNVICHKKVVSSSNGKAEIALPTMDQKSHTHARNTRDNTGIISVYGKSDIYRETVDKVKLDDEIEHADFIKIDAEGHELEILRGARELLLRSRPIVMFEMFQHNLKMAGNTVQDLEDFFVSVNYDLIIHWRQDIIMFPKEGKVEETRAILMDGKL
jgi:FkbM family methyltransferase